MAIIEKCPRCGLFTNSKKNNGQCTHCYLDIDAYWEKLEQELIGTPKCKHGEDEALCETCADEDFEIIKKIQYNVLSNKKKDNEV